MANADKRTVATDALETLGNCPIPDNSGRDAIHLAVEPVEAAETLLPGQHIGLVDCKASGKAQKLIGIVDPFVKGGVKPGELFWLVVYPREITSLRHVWTHPDFAGEGEALGERVSSEQWLRDFCASADCPGYEEVMAKAARVADGQNDAWDAEYLHFDTDAHGEIPAEFWTHVENVLGRRIEGARPTYFSCSC